jgi:hypothetical protein
MAHPLRGEVEASIAKPKRSREADAGLINVGAGPCDSARHEYVVVFMQGHLSRKGRKGNVAGEQKMI